MDVLASLTPSQRRGLAIALVLVGVLVLGVPRLVHRDAPRAATPPLRVARPARAAPRQLVIDVAGAVRRPGLHRLAAGARVDDALAAAGGATPRADIAAVNLAAPLADGEQIVVPLRGTAAVAGASAAGAATAPVDLNSATVEQLDTLPGIGPSTAAKIVAYRQQHGAFRSLEELDAVSGIGPSKLAELKGLVVPP
ncbi:MAG TPA: ComEA family DNA-binding protein [Gaiellaceae bacterium]